MTNDAYGSLSHTREVMIHYSAMADDNTDEMHSIIAAMIARRKQEQTMTDVNNDDDDDDKSMATQNKISPRDVRSFTFLHDTTTTTKEDNKGEDETVVIKKGYNGDAVAAKGQDEEQVMTSHHLHPHYWSWVSAGAKKSKRTAMVVGGVFIEVYAIAFLRDVLRHTLIFTENAYCMRVQEWDVARALELYYNEKGDFSIDDYDNEEEEDDDSYDNGEDEDDDDSYDDSLSKEYCEESITDEDEYEESMSDNHKETMAEENDIDLTTTTLTTEIKDFKDYLINPIFVEFRSYLEMEIKGIVLLRNALIDYLTLVQKCSIDLANKEEVEKIMRHPPASPIPPRQENNRESHFYKDCVYDRSKE